MSIATIVTRGYGNYSSVILVPKRGFGATAVVVARQTPAGRGKRKYVVAIDGVDFEVSSVEEAVSVLKQAKELAKEIAPEVIKASAAVVIRHGIASVTPRIVSKSEEIDYLAIEFQKQFDNIYQDAKVTVEALLKRISESELLGEQRAKQFAEDEEALYVLLMSESMML